MKTISIIGIGEVGSTLASLIIDLSENITLNLLDTNSEISGRILDLQHAAASTDKELVYNSHDLLTQSDIIVYTAGYSNAKGASRNTVAHKNKELIYSIFENIELKKECTIIAITNPVELVASWIDEALKYKHQVIGTGTSLDAFRFKHILASTLNASYKETKVLVLGEHGDHMVPSYSNCTVNGIPILELLDMQTLKDLQIQMIQSANTIRLTEAATKYGIAQVTNLLIKTFLRNQQLEVPLSIRINEHYSTLLNITEPIYMSLPCNIKDGRVQISDQIQLSNQEVSELQTAAKAIAKIYTQHK